MQLYQQEKEFVEDLHALAVTLCELKMTDWPVSKYVNLFGWANADFKYGMRVWDGMRWLLDEAILFPFENSPGSFCTRQELKIAWFSAPVPFTLKRAWTTTMCHDELNGNPRPVYPCYVHVYSLKVVYIWCLHVLAKHTKGWRVHIGRVSFIDDKYKC